MLQIEVRSVSSVVLGSSRRIGGTDSRCWSLASGGSPFCCPCTAESNQARASGPSFRISACSSASRSIRAFLNLQLVDLTSRSRCSSSHTDESRRFLDMGRNVARPRLSTTPLGLRRSSTSYKGNALCSCGCPFSIELARGSLTLGTKTRQRVAVVQNMMNTEMRMKEASFRSDSTIAMAAPMTHIITTLYTLSPMCFESLSAGMETCLVSHAKKAPNTWEGKGPRLE